CCGVQSPLQSAGAEAPRQRWKRLLHDRCRGALARDGVAAYKALCRARGLKLPANVGSACCTIVVAVLLPAVL
ncbi:hypothetical protein RZS08_26985, partial [Arthrospira platensis SPKY1]|nr:hypothetical protein [Arthrospira platensis SPKY1]